MSYGEFNTAVCALHNCDTNKYIPALKRLPEHGNPRQRLAQSESRLLLHKIALTLPDNVQPAVSAPPADDNQPYSVIHYYGIFRNPE